MTFQERMACLAQYGVAAIGQSSTIRGLLGLKGAAFKAHWFPRENEPSTFPPLDQALLDPSGLLAIGGKASACSLHAAFRKGIFICNQAHQPTKWWSPDPRMVLFPEDIYLQKTLKRLIRNDRFAISIDQAFAEVVDACAYPRANSPENWVHPLKDAYKALFNQGHAFSIEAWDQEGNLAGGVFGLTSGRHLSVESMFTRVNHASKIALAHLCAHLRHWDYPLIDMQMPTSHLASLGCRAIFRDEYLSILEQSINKESVAKPWAIEVKPDDKGAPILLEQPTLKVAATG